MGNYLPSFYSEKNKIKVWYLNQDQIIYVSQNLTLKNLKTQLDSMNPNPKEVFYDWVPVDSSHDNTTLQKIIENKKKTLTLTLPKESLLIVIDSQHLLEGPPTGLTRENKLRHKLKQMQKVDEENLPQFELGRNGQIVFEGRQTALLGSSVGYALLNSECDSRKRQTFFRKFEQKQNKNEKLPLVGRLLRNFGFLSRHNDRDNMEEIQKLLDKLKDSKEYSDFDPKFVYFIIEIYFKFMLQSKGKIYYIDYKSIDDFKIASIPSNSKVGILGDFGTGLKDSIQLLSNMILKHDVDVILHLGDVYYAGTPHEYEVGIIKPLNDLRIAAKKQIRFYSIPGNHDYYSWGLPFLCFVKGINQKDFHKQQASYFCIRDEANKWQFLGMDTAFYDSNPLQQIRPDALGPHVQQKQLKWHKNQIETFPGSTIVLSHHQLFSIHERINGKLTKYRNFSCINPMLYAQMFEKIGDISAWFWGHEHSLMLFKEGLFGLQKGRLLGNSSFHVFFEKQDPYTRQKGFPNIPFVVQDGQYRKKYLPVNPNIPVGNYFALSYAVFDLGKLDAENNLPVEYWCSPSYSNEQIEGLQKLTTEQKDKIYFQEYKLYEETIFSKEKLIKQRLPVENQNKVYLRSEIGLSLGLRSQEKNLNQKKVGEKNVDHTQIVDKAQTKMDSKQLGLNLEGIALSILFLEQQPNKQTLRFALKLNSDKLQSDYYLGVSNNSVELVQISSIDQIASKNAAWTCVNPHNSSRVDFSGSKVFFNQAIMIRNQSLGKSLSWQILNHEVYPCLEEATSDLESQLHIENLSEQNTESLWKFQSQNLINNY